VRRTAARRRRAPGGGAHLPGGGAFRVAVQVSGAAPGGAPGPSAGVASRRTRGGAPFDMRVTGFLLLATMAWRGSAGETMVLFP
jgi:hypothetical protein